MPTFGRAAQAALFSFSAQPNYARLALLFGALLASAPFLLPEHHAPIASFYDEWLGMALGTAAAAAFALHIRAARTPIPELALWLTAFAAWLLIGALLQRPAYWQLPLSGFIYVVFAAALAWLGHGLARQFGAEQIADVLAAVIAAAATLNAAIGLLQFYGIPEALSDIVARTSGPRVVGHVGQANLFADYLALGEASVLYLMARGRLRGVAAWLPAGLMVLASSYTQSRGAILFSLWLFALALYTRRAGPSWRSTARSAGLLLGAMLAAMWLVPRMHEALGLRPALSGLDRLLDRDLIGTEPRLDAWPLAVRLFFESPWLGVGWGEFAGASFRSGIASNLASHPVLWVSPHNLPLQVLAESGLLGALLVIAAAFRWWRPLLAALRRSPTLPQWWAAAIAGTVCLHGLVEYPFWYAHMLGLTALVAGIAARQAVEWSAHAVRRLIFFGSAGLFILLAWAYVDYQRFVLANVVATGATLASPQEVSRALAQLDEVAAGPLGGEAGPWLYRSRPLDSAAFGARIEMGERALRRWPSSQLIARHAATLQRAGKNGHALEILQRASIDRGAVCLELDRLAAEQPILRGCEALRIP